MNTKFKVHYKEKLYFTILLISSLLLYSGLLWSLISGVKNFTIFFYYGAAFLIVRLLASAFLMGFLKGNAIKMSRKQFPEVFKIAERYSKELELGNVPEMYLLQGGGMLNAFAARVARRDFVVLYSDVLEVAYQEGIDAVSFIIGHELGHVKRNHTGFIKWLLIWPGTLIPFLGSAYSRACEYTCDNIGYNLCPEGAEKGILILAAGKKLYKKVNISELIFSMEYSPGFAVWFFEIFSSHPALIKRLAVLNQLNRDNFRLESQTFTSPKVKIKHSEIQQ